MSAFRPLWIALRTAVLATAVFWVALFIIEKVGWQAPHGLALLADRLALAGGQRAQEVVEGAVTVVPPVILLAEPQQPAMRAEALPLLFCAEGGVDRAYIVVAGDLGEHVDQCVTDSFGKRAGTGKQARSGHWREGHGDLELGIVATAGALQRLRPAVVEHVLALRMGLHVERCSALQRAVVRLRQQILRLPSGAPSHRLGVFQRLEEAVAEEGAARRARRERAGIPLGGVDRAERIDDAQTYCRGIIRHAPIIARIVPA